MVTSWSDGICMSNVNGKNIRCKNKIHDNNDFCRVHMKQHIYSEQLLKEKTCDDEKETLVDDYLENIINNFDIMINEKCNILNNDFMYNLIGLENDWKNVPFMYWIQIDNMWWDIRTLSSTFAAQINQSELERPLPIYPENPFNRNKLSIEDLQKLKEQLEFINNVSKQNKISINIALKHFLSFPTSLMKSLLKDKKQYTMSVKIINKFSDKLRYKMINCKDSQGKYCGYWVTISEPLSEFEKCYDKIIHAMVVLNSGNGQMMFSRLSYRNITHTINMLGRLKPEEYII